MTGRFAPSPTGRMHLGNVYAMLAAWLQSRHSQQSIVLRIEDIDTPRVKPHAVEWICEDLQWLGLNWNGDITFQSQRTALYELALQVLQEQTVECFADGQYVELPLVYPCYCSRAQIQASAPHSEDGILKYAGTCRKYAYKSANMHNNCEHVQRDIMSKRHSWRIVAPDKVLSFQDEIFGLQTFNLYKDIGDTVICRSDGLFSYQLVVVVDDLLMGVDNIVRGRDLLRFTALQIWIRNRLIQGHFIERAFDNGYVETCNSSSQQVTYAHIPLLCSTQGERLAKRKHDMDLGKLREYGISREAIVGFCAYALGLIPSLETISAQELISLYSAEKIANNIEDVYLPDNIIDVLKNM
ncbi:MAG: glutamyl-Q tRNA(Asp) synthetase [Bifidobacteriaceae bacterium]|nr:glutamyl-Q tRNA(Asp) synthetase [Bifidobacteriaceae bacterium]